MATAEQAAMLPLAGRRVPEFALDEVREMIKKGYRIVYLVTDEHVEIVTVCKGTRLLRTDILDR